MRVRLNTVSCTLANKAKLIKYPELLAGALVNLNPITMTQEALEKTSGILPEAWYDLIARLVPGAFTVITTIPSLTIPKGLLEGLLVGLIFFYITGFFLEVFAELVIGMLWPKIAESVRLLFCPKKASRQGIFQAIATVNDSLEFWNDRNRLRPSQWQAVSKMSAESDMFRSLAAYFILQIILFVLMTLYNYNPAMFSGLEATRYFSRVRILPIEVSILMGASCLWYMTKQYKGAQNRLKSYIEINSRNS